MKRLGFLFMLMLVILGCQDRSASPNLEKDANPVVNQKETSWTPSPMFRDREGDRAATMIGQYNKLTAICQDGKFVEDQPYKCMWHVWGEHSKIENKPFVVKGVYRETGQTEDLFSTLSLAGPNRGADFHVPSNITLSKPGLWRMDIYIDQKLFGSIIVDVKRKPSS